MKKLLYFFVLLLFVACNDDDIVISTDLTKRVMILEGYDPTGVFVSDSIVEYFDNKLITNREYYFRIAKDSSFIPFYYSFEYTSNNLLQKVNTYNDINLSDLTSTTEFAYNSDQRIQSIIYDKTNPSNFSDELYNYEYDYEYISDTVKAHLEYFRNNTTTFSQDTYVLYGSIDSIHHLEDSTIHVFNSDNDLEKIKFAVDSTSSYFGNETEVTYGSSRFPLIDNVFGNKTNVFLISAEPVKYYEFELSNAFVEEYFYKGTRANNLRTFNYTFDLHNRLSEIKTSGTFTANQTIRYFYD